jgi:hypothetical protein
MYEDTGMEQKIENRQSIFGCVALGFDVRVKLSSGAMVSGGVNDKLGCVAGGIS